MPAALSLATFAWLLSLHPTVTGHVYGAYGGVHIGVAVVWLMLADKIKPTPTDWVGVALSLLGGLPHRLSPENGQQFRCGSIRHLAMLETLPRPGMDWATYSRPKARDETEGPYFCTADAARVPGPATQPDAWADRCHRQPRTGA